jgi:hypothetical protein
VLITPPPQVASPPAIDQVRFGFAGLTIGANLTDLHRVRPRAVCAELSAGLTECQAPDQSLGGGYFARDLTYRFTGQRLTEIRFHSSIDGFAFVVARLRHDFGAPADIRRDDVRLDGHLLPHVAFTWRNGRSTIRMSDPATPDQLRVTIALDTPAPPPDSLQPPGRS